MFAPTVSPFPFLYARVDVGIDPYMVYLTKNYKLLSHPHGCQLNPSVPSGHLPLIRGVGLSPPNPLRWALAGTPIKCLRCTSTAYSGITVAVGQLRMHLLNYRRTKQVGTQEAVYVRITYSQILMEEGPCGPGVKRRTVKIWAAGKYETTEVAHSRK